MNARAGQVADALLAISDERAARAKNQGAKKAYEKLRPSGKKHVETAVPRLGRLIAKYASAAASAAAPPRPRRSRGVASRSAQLQPPTRVGATATSSYQIARAGPCSWLKPNLKT